MSHEEPPAVCTKHIFPFLDLPYELQALIYKKYYESDELVLDSVNVVDDSTGQVSESPRFKGVPNLSIERLSREIFHHSRIFKNTHLPRTLKINALTLLHPRTMAQLVCDPRYFWIRGHIEDVVIVKSYSAISRYTGWSSLLKTFPNMKRLYLKRLLIGRWTSQSYFEKTVQEYTQEKCTELLIGVMKREFGLQSLKEALSSVGREIQIDVSFHWNRRLTGTDRSFYVIMEGSVLDQGSWDVSCRVVDEDHSEWDDFLPREAVIQGIAE